MPKGCFIQLEKLAKDYILRNIKSSANTKSNLVSKLKYFEEDTSKLLTLSNFLQHYHLSLYDFYGKNGDRSFSRMLVEAGLKEDFQYENEKFITSRLPSMFHLYSPTFIKFMLSYIEEGKVHNDEEKLMLSMFYYTFYKAYPEKEGLTSIEDGIYKILSVQEFKEEIKAILEYLYYSIQIMEIKSDFPFLCPLQVHCSYTTSQVMAAFDYYNEEKTPAFREGVKHFEDKNVDIFFITLNKSDKEFSPSTLYDDYAINERLFHWQTQSKVSESIATAKRYINHRQLNHQIALFVREYKKENGYTSPFVFLGTAEHVQHSGSKPMSFIWKLKEEMPSYLVPRANKNIL